MKTETKEKPENTMYHDTVKECPLLYCDASKPMSETCMCWGWECGEGWYNEIRALSLKLEALNCMFYPTFRVRIQADQVKEKFGRLEFYHSVVVDPRGIKYWLATKFNNIYEWMRHNIKYEYKTDKISEGEYTYETEKVDKVGWVKAKYQAKHNNSMSLEEKDGEYFVTHKIWHCPKYNTYATKHKFLLAIQNLMFKLYCTFNSYSEPSPRQNAIMELADHLAFKYINEASERCYERCEDCGTWIGSDYSPRCQTTGWIRYICEDCADAREFPYVKNGETWAKGVRTETKEERNARHEKYEKQAADRSKEWDKEREEYEKELAEAEAEVNEKKEEKNENT